MRYLIIFISLLVIQACTAKQIAAVKVQSFDTEYIFLECMKTGAICYSTQNGASLDYCRNDNGERPEK